MIDMENFTFEKGVTNMPRGKMTLASMCDGGVQERIDRALMKIADNILDPNTEAKKKRSLTVTISFVPNEDDREDVTVDVSTSIKLAPETGLKTQLYIDKDLTSGTISLTEHAKGQIKGQLTFDDIGVTYDTGNEEMYQEPDFDPETGEIFTQEEQKSRVVSMRAVANQ